MIRILIVEDHVYTAQGLKSALESEPGMEVVGAAGRGSQGLDLAMRLKPDVILLDLRLPDRQPVRQLIRSFVGGPWKVIVFSAEDRTAFVEACLEMGADAFLLKEEPPRVLITCIRKLLAGHPQPIVSSSLRQTELDLSPGLEEVLKLLGKGMKYQEIAAKRYSSPETVRKQCERLQIKLGLASREQLIAWAINNGYASAD